MKNQRIYKIIGIVLVLLVFLPAICSASRKAQPLIPSDDKVLLIIGQNKSSIIEYIQAFGRVPAGFMSYTSIHYVDGLIASADHGAGEHHLQYFCDTYPNTVLQIGLYMVGILDEIVAGEYNANIEKLANWLKDIRVPVYLRIGYEFDYPQNHYDPKKYIAAYRYIVDKLTDLQVDNVAYVWHSYAGYVEGDLMRWYPGDEYVDWVGLSFFDPYAKGFRLRIVKIAKERGKPLMVAESTPKGIDLTSKKAWRVWFQRLFDFVEENQVKAVSYINADWESQPMFRGQDWGDTRIQNVPEIKEKWEKAVSAPQYLHASETLYTNIGF